MSLYQPARGRGLRILVLVLVGVVLLAAGFATGRLSAPDLEAHLDDLARRRAEVAGTLDVIPTEYAEAAGAGAGEEAETVGAGVSAALERARAALVALLPMLARVDSDAAAEASAALDALEAAVQAGAPPEQVDDLVRAAQAAIVGG